MLRRTRRSLNALPEFFFAAPQSYKKHLAAVVFNQSGQLDNMFVVVGLSVNEGEDEVEPGLSRLFDDLFAESANDSVERGRAKGEKGQHGVDADVVVEQLEPGLLGKFTGDGELTRSGRSIEENEFHPLMLPQIFFIAPAFETRTKALSLPHASSKVELCLFSSTALTATPGA